MKHVLSLAFALVMSVGQAHAASRAELVAAFFPAALKMDGGGAAVPSSELESAFCSGDLDHTGHELVAAVYSNGVDGVVAVLSPDGTGSLVASADFSVAGHRPEITLLDLDHDERPEIVVSFHATRGSSETWLYGWNGAALTLLAPVDRHNEVVSDVFEPTFLDVDGDNRIDVIDFQSARTVDDEGVIHQSTSYRLMSLKEGKLIVVAPLDEVFAASRGAGAPAPSREEFSVTDPEIARVLTLVNGDMRGAHRVSSAIISVNGQKVFTEKDFRQNVARLEVPVSVKTENTITAELRGEPGATITVLIRRR